MRTTIDGAGRIVVPKALRERLLLGAGTEVEITERDGVIEISSAPASLELIETEHGTVANPSGDLPKLTDEELLATIARSRR